MINLLKPRSTFVATPLPARKRRVQQRCRVRLRLEALEHRITPFGDNVWIGPVDGFWSGSGNWSMGRPPIEGDTLHFGAGDFGYGTGTSSIDDIPTLSVHEIRTEGMQGRMLIENKDLTVTEDFFVYGDVQIIGASHLNLGNMLYIGGLLETGGPDGDPTTITTGGSIVVICSGTWEVGCGPPEGPRTVVVAGHVQIAGFLHICGELDVTTNDFRVYPPPCGVLEVEGVLNYTGTAPLVIQGTVILNGGLIIAGEVKLDGGDMELPADGRIQGDLNNESGRIHFDDVYSSALFIVGNFAQGPLGRLERKYHGDDQFDVTGTASLGGTLVVAVTDAPIQDSELSDTQPDFYVVNARGGAFGDFASIILPGLPAGWTWGFVGWITDPYNYYPYRYVLDAVRV